MDSRWTETIHVCGLLPTHKAAITIQQLYNSVAQNLQHLLEYGGYHAPAPTSQCASRTTYLALQAWRWASWLSREALFWPTLFSTQKVQRQTHQNSGPVHCQVWKMFADHPSNSCPLPYCKWGCSGFTKEQRSPCLGWKAAAYKPASRKVMTSYCLVQTQCWRWTTFKG